MCQECKNSRSDTMSPKRRSSAKEVTVEIKDSEPRSKSYWNLRGSKKQDCVKDISQDLQDLNNEINIEFNLNENRELTEGQKQTILKTLLKEQEQPEEDEDFTYMGNYSDQPFDKGIVLLFLVVLSGLGFAFLITNIRFY